MQLDSSYLLSSTKKIKGKDRAPYSFNPERTCL